MAKLSIPRSNAPATNNGGIMGTGVFGMFGSVVNCKAEDGSTYCEFVKIFNVLIMLLVIFFIIYFVYTFFQTSFSSKHVGRRSR